MRVFLKEGGYVVTDQSVTTPRAVHRLAEISTVSVRYQVALSALIPALALVGATIGFWRYLYIGEILFLLGASLVTMLLAVSVGTLTVSSVALAHAPELRQTWGRIDLLKRVRNAIAEAMVERDRAKGATL